MTSPSPSAEEIRRIFNQVSSLPAEKQGSYLDTVCKGRPELREEVSSLLDHADDTEALLRRVDDDLTNILHAAFGSEAPPGPSAGDDRSGSDRDASADRTAADRSSADSSSADPSSADPSSADPSSGDNRSTGNDRSAGEPTDPISEMQTTVARYRVEQRIGSGGMGVVYRAHDPKLDRPVALKFLSRAVSADETAIKRFMREARAASAIEHPNICPVHDIDETEDGRLFIAMAYLEGETLAARIARGPVPAAEAVGVAVQASRALERAHERGIVHCDIKPANLIVDPYGTVRLLDFGIATLAGSGDVTREGGLLGTAAYMSPEQLRDRDVDHRTDIWSLGVVLYEMIAGRRPFTGAYDHAVMYAIANTNPEPLSRYCSKKEIVDVVHQALRKDPDERYADMGAFREALLEAGGERPPSLREKSILVLPFDDVSPQHDNQYFSEGLSEELISGLSQVGSLRVICRTSAWQAKASNKDVNTLSRELGVGFILDGSVRKAGNRIRVTPQLIDAATQSTVWSDKYDGDLEDVFDIQDRVAQATIRSLKLKLSADENERLGRRPIRDVQAYECYLRARQAVLEYTPESLDKALRHLHDGLDIVGDNALLFAGLGYVHFTYANLGVDREVNLAKAEAQAGRAFKEDPRSPQAYRLLGLIAALQGDQAEALRQLRHSYDEDPHDLETLQWLHLLYAYVGLTEMAWPIVKRELSLDPLNPMSLAAPGWLHFMEGRFDLALTPYRSMYEMDPENPAYIYFYAQILAYTNDIDAALGLIERLQETMPEHPYTWLCACFAHALQGDAEGVAASVTPALEGMCRSDMSHAWFIADCFAMVHDTDRALDWLETAVDLGFVNHTFLAEKDRFLANVRGEPRFDELMDRVRKVGEEFASEFQ